MPPNPRSLKVTIADAWGEFSLRGLYLNSGVGRHGAKTEDIPPRNTVEEGDVTSQGSGSGVLWGSILSGFHVRLWRWSVPGFRKGCDVVRAGSAEAQFDLGDMYSRGRGRKHTMKAYAWFNLAAAQEEENAAEAKDSLLPKMTSDQVAAVDKLVDKRRVRKPIEPTKRPALGTAEPKQGVKRTAFTLWPRMAHLRMAPPSFSGSQHDQLATPGLPNSESILG